MVKIVVGQGRPKLGEAGSACPAQADQTGYTSSEKTINMTPAAPRQPGTQRMLSLRRTTPCQMKTAAPAAAIGTHCIDQTAEL